LEQLHKSLFDEEELTALLTEAGFGRWIIFNYCYPGEAGRPVSLGFYATAGRAEPAEMQDACLAIIKDVASNRVILETVRWLRGPMQ
jgi:hypothetical protein